MEENSRGMEKGGFFCTRRRGHEGGEGKRPLGRRGRVHMVIVDRWDDVFFFA